MKTFCTFILQEKLVEMVFDRFNAEGVYVQEQSLMALYSYKATSGIVGRLLKVMLNKSLKKAVATIFLFFCLKVN